MVPVTWYWYSRVPVAPVSAALIAPATPPTTSDTTGTFVLRTWSRTSPIGTATTRRFSRLSNVTVPDPSTPRDGVLTAASWIVTAPSKTEKTAAASPAPAVLVVFTSDFTRLRDESLKKSAPTI